MAQVVSNNGSTSSCQDLKVNRINAAYSKIRISGLTVLPSPEDLELALMRLEEMMHELEGARNICLNFNFEQEPDPNSVSNISSWALDGISSLLAERLIPDFNKAVPPQLMLSSRSSMSAISGKVLRDRLRRVQYPDRMPIGSGNYRYPRWLRFYHPVILPPNDCSTNQIKIGETNNYTISFCQELADDETIISFTMEASDGLTTDNEVLSGNDIEYTVTAVSQASDGAWQRVRVTVVTDEGRTLIRDVNFEVCRPQDLNDVI
jgi:hypothetical protein